MAKPAALLSEFRATQQTFPEQTLPTDKGAKTHCRAAELSAVENALASAILRALSCERDGVEGISLTRIV